MSTILDHKSEEFVLSTNNNSKETNNVQTLYFSSDESNGNNHSNETNSNNSHLYQLSNMSFSKIITKHGHGLNAPNEGSQCKIYVKNLSINYLLDYNEHCNDLLPFEKEQDIQLGFYKTIIADYIHKCLFTMKKNEKCELTFEYCSQSVQEQSNIETSSSVHFDMKFLVHLIDFERQCEIYNMPIQTLYDYALIHKQNANIFFEKKIYSYALKLYHRSLSYASNFTTDEPNEENNELLKELDKLIVSIYTNIAALQLKYSNNHSVIINCSHALYLEPTYIKALFRRGCAYLNLNDYELALNDFRLAQTLEPNDVKIQQYLKQTTQKLEQYEKTLSNSLKKLF